MDFDKRTVFALVISFSIIILWSVFFPPSEINKKKIAEEQKKAIEQVIVASKKDSLLKTELNVQSESTITIKEKIVNVEDDLVSRELTNLNGVRFLNYFTKKHKLANGNFVSLLNDSLNNGYTAVLNFKDNRVVKLNDINFQLVDSNRSKIILTKESPTISLKYLAYLDGIAIYKTLKFYYNEYHHDVTFDFSQIKEKLKADGIAYYWLNGMPYTETNPLEDDNLSLVFVQGQEDYYRFDTNEPESEVLRDSIKIDYFSIRSKFFVSAVIPEDESIKQVTGFAHQKTVHEHLYRYYDIEMKSQLAVNKFVIYSGPNELEYLDRYEKYNLSNMFLNASGYEHIFRWIAKGAHFSFLILNDYLGNYGLAIIVFVILLKLVLHPLTIKSARGMKAMQEMQPKMAAIKEKYKDEPQKVQQATMKMYQEEGVNPLGGCLPQLLQMPLLMALYLCFRTAVEFRGADFLWINDLASPDALPLGFSMFGVEHINILPILMAISQIMMSRQTMVSVDASQKFMVYAMPLVMMVMFYSWSAAINFYYFLFNVATYVSQLFIQREPKVVVQVNEAPDGYKINQKTSPSELLKGKDTMYKKKK